MDKRKNFRNGNADRDGEKGVALFMVIAAIAMLSILVTEFTYVASINRKMAFDSLDMVKAHYLAKSGLKLSLLRLKAYQQVKGVVSGLGGGAAGAASGIAGAVPKGVIEKIWSFPFIYPIPTELPGLTLGQKESIAEFQKDSGFDGNFSAVITSESSKYNLNRILGTFAAVAPSPSPAPSTAPSASPSGTPGPTPSTSPSFSPADAQKNLTDFLGQILANKFDADPDFAAEYRDYQLNDFMDNLFAWADRTYERKQRDERDDIAAMKKMPFNSLSELHMIQPLGDELYELFSSSLTVSSTPGININTMQDDTLRALVPQMTKDEVSDFFKFRDSTDEDNLFKSPDDFFKYLLNNIAAFRHDQNEVNKFKDDLDKKVRLVIDETEFKITVQASVNQSTRLIEAWVTLGAAKPSTTTSNTGANPTNGAANPATPAPPPQPQVDVNGNPIAPDPGLRITYMRIL